MRSLSYNDTSFTSDPSQQLTSKNNILMNTSLNKSFELKKDRFYDNSRYVNHV